MFLMAASWIWELKRWMQDKRKNAADAYSSRVNALISAAQDTDESFESFRTILEIAMNVVRDRRAMLMRGVRSAGVAS